MFCIFQVMSFFSRTLYPSCLSDWIETNIKHQNIAICHFEVKNHKNLGAAWTLGVLFFPKASEVVTFPRVQLQCPK